MKVFLTGATGYVGSVVADALLLAGHSVIGLARNQVAAEHLAMHNIEPVIGDVRNPVALTRYAQEADGVIHAAMPRDLPDLTEVSRIDGHLIVTLADALAGTNKPLIVSSVSAVLGDTGDNPVDESALVATNFGPAVRVLSEEAAHKAGNRNVRNVIIRLPPFLHGRGGSMLVPSLIQYALRNGKSIIVDDGAYKTSAVHVDDAARLYVLALEHAPAGSLYHAATENTVTIKSIADSIARLTQKPTASLSRVQAQEAIGRFAAMLAINNCLNATKATYELGWQPVAPLLLEDIEHGSYRQPVMRNSSSTDV